MLIKQLEASKYKVMIFNKSLFTVYLLLYCAYCCADYCCNIFYISGVIDQQNKNLTNT